MKRIKRFEKEFWDCTILILISKPVPIRDVCQYIAILQHKDYVEFEKETGAISGEMLGAIENNPVAQTVWLIQLAGKLREKLINREAPNPDNQEEVLSDL